MRQFFSLCLLALCIVAPLHGIKLNSNGGYEVTVVIDENDQYPGSNYVDNIKEAFRKLSHLLYQSTKETFFIQNLNIVIPSTWELEDSLVSDEPAMATFSTADVRLSKQTTFPYVINPNPCLQPGEFISLPSSFFDLTNNGAYGLVEKALLVQWTRYRFGAWDEHGIPGHKTFPYFYKPEVAQGSQVWHVTGCNNAPLNGTYEAADGSICDEEWEGELNEECRFIPDRTVNPEIKSSLMHFHWLESVTEFCNETTHNQDVPNKQNYFCNYRSVMETIQSSVDYQQVEEPVRALPIMKTKIQRPSNLPVLYILLDRGHFNVDNLTGIVNVAQTAVAQLVGTTLKKETVAAVGAFPTSSFDQGVTELLSWRQIQGNENHFIDTIADLTTTGPEERDFAHAITQASELISQASPVNGGVILLVKTGVPSDFSMTPYETQVETALLSQGSRLFAIEVNGFPQTAQNLRRLANATSGVSAAINKPVLSTEVSDLIGQVAQVFNGNSVSVPSARTAQIVYEQDVTSGEHVIVPIPSGTEQVTFTLVHSESTTSASVGVNTTHFVTFSTPEPEWANDVNSTMTRFRSAGQMPLAVESNVGELIFVFTSPTNTSGHLIVTAQGNDLEEDYEIRVFTTAQDNVLDFNKTADSLTPFVISTQVTKGQKPVIGLQVEVTLTLSSATGSNSTTVVLKDDGLGTPDVGENDGVYSAAVIPSSDGSYSISVVVKADATILKTKKVERLFGGLDVQSRLLPIDQGEGIGCGTGGCEGVTPSIGFTRTVDVVQPVEVKNRVLFAYGGKPMAINDLILAEGNAEYEVFLNFTTPEILGQPGESPVLYALYAAASRQALINLDLSAPLPQGVENPMNYTSPSLAPGTPQSRQFLSTRGGLFYMALVGWNGNTFGEVGRIQSKTVIAAPIDETTEGNGSSTTEDGQGEGEGEENKSWIKKPGGIITIIVIVLVVFGVAGGGYWYMKKKRSGSATTSTSQLNA